MRADLFYGYPNLRPHPQATDATERSTLQLGNPMDAWGSEGDPPEEFPKPDEIEVEPIPPETEPEPRPEIRPGEDPEIRPDRPTEVPELPEEN